MASINFTRETGSNSPLFLADCGAGTANALVAYLLPEGDSSTKDSLTLSETWTEHQGFYIFFNTPITNQSAFISSASNYLNGFQFPQPPRLTWVQNPNGGFNSSTVVSLLVGSDFSVGADQPFNFRGNMFGWMIKQGCPVSVDETNNWLVIENLNGSSIYLTQGTNPNLGVVTSSAYVPLCGDESGCLQFQVTLEQSDVDQLDAGLRYYISAGAPTSNQVVALSTQRYPIFNLTANGSSLSLMANIDPLATFDQQPSGAPLNSSRNFFQFNGQAGSTTPAAPASLATYFAVNTGQAVTLIPTDTARLVFAVNPALSQASATDPFYLVPMGDFVINTSGAGAGNALPYRLMCGLFGTEYFGVTVASDNLLSFVPGQPAYAPNFPQQGQSGNGSPLLINNATTAWASIKPVGNGASYFAQPQSAPLFAVPGSNSNSQPQLLSLSNGSVSGQPPTGGTFTLTYGGQTTTALNYNAQASDVQAALAALSNVGPGNVTCSGGGLPGTPISVLFGSSVATASFTGDGSLLQGGAGDTFSVFIFPTYLSYREVGLAQIDNSGASHPAPLVPYSGVVPSTSSNGIDPQLLPLFETKVLTLERKNQITNQGEAVKSAARTLRATREANAASGSLREAATDNSTQNTTTPQGFVVELKTGSGTSASWGTMNLALTDPVQTQGMQDAESTTNFSILIKDDLTQDAFQRNQICLVITSLDPEHFVFSTLEGLLSFAGWQFNISPPAPSSTGIGAAAGDNTCGADEGDFTNCPTALIFKFYDNTSLLDLLGKPDSWTYGTTFNTDVDQTQDYLTKYLQVAQDDVETNGSASLYYDLVQKITSQTWNGILALNVHLPPTSLPDELEGLKSGIGELSNLRAFHVGIEVNDVQNMSLNKSSLFALIDFENPDAPPSPDENGYSFFVPKLQISFVNSEINYFFCEVDVSLGSFFGETSTTTNSASALARNGEAAAEGDDSAAVIKIFGTYQNHDGESVYSFVTETEYDFTFPGSTFLKSLTLNKVQFATTTIENEGNSVKSSFSFWGNLKFQILGAAGGTNPPLDPFSFSTLSFADLSLGMSYLEAPQISFSPATGTGQPTGGTFTLSYGGQTTSALNYNAPASDVQTALAALSNVGPGNVTCSGGALPGSPISVLFGSSVAAASFNGDGSLLQGGTFNVNIGTVTSTTFSFNPGDIRFDLGSSTSRSDSFLSRLPLKLKSFMYSECANLTLESLNYYSLGTAIFDLPETTNFQYALVLELDLGSMGALVSSLSAFKTNIIVGWIPANVTMDPDYCGQAAVKNNNGGKAGMAVGIQLPDIHGKLQIGVEGVLQLTIETFILDYKNPTDPNETQWLALIMQNCTLDILGTNIPPDGTQFSVYLFAPPSTSSAKSLSEQIAWAVTVDRTGGGDGGDGQIERARLALPAAGVAGEGDDNGGGGEGGNGDGNNGDGGGGGSLLDLKYLGLGQRVGPDEGVITSFQSALDWMQKDFTEAVTNSNFSEVYKPDQSWIVVAKLSLLSDVVTLGGVFYDPEVYSLLVSLKGFFDFEITYTKISDDIGMYYINVGPPPELRQLQFGAVSVTIPNFAVSIYTNGDFKVDVGFPANLDFSKSFQIQSLPFTGAGGFYFAKLSAATSDVFPQPSYHTILEFGIGVQLGLGKDFQQGILSAGLSITFYGILEGALGYGPMNLPASNVQLDKPDALSVKGQFGIIGKIYGTINFGIIQATVTVDLQAGVGIQMLIPDQNYLQLWIQASVSLSVSIRINLLFFHITISFSFKASIRFDWQIPYGNSSSSKSTSAALFSFGAIQTLPVARLKPLNWLPDYRHARLAGAAAAPPLNIYFMPELTMIYPSLGQPGAASCIASLIIECPDPNGMTGDGSNLKGASAQDQFTILVAASSQGQQISISPGSVSGQLPTGGTFTLTYGGQTTSALNYNTQASDVQAALAALSSIGNPSDVACSGGALPGQAVSVAFAFPFTQLLTAFAGWVMNNALTSETFPAQRVSIGPGALTKGQPVDGTFTLTCSGETTAPIPYNAEADVVATALENLSIIGPGNVICTGGPLPVFPVDFDYVGEASVPCTLAGDGGELFLSTGDKFTIAVSQPSTLVQQVSFSAGTVTGDAPTAGTFTLTYNKLTTQLLNFDAAASDVQSALQNLLSIGAGNVTCSGGPLPTTPISVQFGGAITQPTPLTGDGTKLARSDTFPISINPVTDTVFTYQTQQISLETSGGQPTGGTFTLGYNGQTTSALNYNAPASDVQAALAALSNINAGNVFCNGGPLPGTPVVVQLVENNTPAQALTYTSQTLTLEISPMVTRDQLKLLDFVLRLTPTLARPMSGLTATDTTSTLDYGTLVSFLTANFDVSVGPAPNHASSDANAATPFSATYFPIIPDLEVKTQGRVNSSQQPDEYTCQFWNYNLRDTTYQDYLSQYFEKQFINVSSQGNGETLAAADDSSISIATVVFQDYFDMIAKQLVDTMYQQVTNSGGDYGMSFADLLAYVTSLDQVVSMAGMVSKVFRGGLRLPGTTDPSAAVDGIYDLIGQQFAAEQIATGQTSYNVMLDNSQAPNQWVTLNNASVAIPQSVLSEITPVQLTPTFPGGVQKLPYLNYTNKTFAFQTFTPWVQSGTSLTLASFSTDLLNALSTNPSGFNIELKSTDSSTPISTDDPVVPTSQYNWATSLQLTVRQVPQTGSGGNSGNTFIPNVYQVGGADAASQQYLESLFAYFESQGGTQGFLMNLLYQTGSGQTGLNSVNLTPQQGQPSSTFIIRTNMSTEALPPPSATGEQADESLLGATTDLQVDASFDKTQDFLDIIEDCSVTNQSGYFLFYEDPSSGDGLPTALFNGSNPAPLTLLIVNTNNAANPSSSQLLPIYNTLVFNAGVQPTTDHKLYYGEAASIPAWSVAVAPGCIGFSINRNNPNPPDGSAPSTEASLESLYNSLGWTIAGDQNFCESIESLPVGPVSVWPNGQTTVEPPIWQYTQFAPVYKYAKANNDGNCNNLTGYLSRYAGIGQPVTMDFQLLDVFGDVLSMPNNVQSVSFNNLYFDDLIPMSQWLGVTFEYDFQVNSGKPATPNTVQITVGLDSGSLPTQEQADKLTQLIETYQLIYDQITAPATTFYLESSLDPQYYGQNAQQQKHDLPSTDAQNLTTFVQGVLTTLQNILNNQTPAPPANVVIVYTFEADHSPSVLPEMFELSVILGIHRNDFIDPTVNLKDNPTTQDAPTPITASVNADYSTLNQYLQNLQSFGTRFQQAFAELVLATAGQGTSSALWAVKEEVVGIQISAPYVDQKAMTNRSVYYSPKPLYNYLKSETVLVPDYSNLTTLKDPGATPLSKTFVDVDSDVYCRQFFDAFESFMSPGIAVSARRIMEAANQLSSFDSIIEAKAALADAYAQKQVELLFQSPSLPQGSQSAAVDAMGQQLRTSLASAYLVDTVVQYPVTWTTSPPASLGGNVNLFGQVAAVPNGTSSANNNYTLSTAKVELYPADGPYTFGSGGDAVTAPSLLGFLFGATSIQAMEAFASVTMDLQYQVTHLEFRPAANDDWSWLQLVQPINVHIGPVIENNGAGQDTSAEIPIPLRQYPIPPTLMNQAGGSPFNTDPTDLADARLWQYVYSYQVQEIAQDVIHTSVTYNTGSGKDDATRAMLAEDGQAVSLFEALCRFYYAYPALQPTLAQLPTVTNPGQATPAQVNAILCFSQLVQWMATNTDWFPLNSQEDLMSGAAPTSYTCSYTLTDVETLGTPPQRTLTLCPDSASDCAPPCPLMANLNVMPLLLTAQGDYAPPTGVSDQLEGNCQTITYPLPLVPGSATEYQEGPGTMVRRQITITNLDILNTENTLAGVQIYRNEDLFVGDGTNSGDTWTTMTDFVYQTPLVCFNNKTTPLIDNSAAIDIADLTGKDQTLPLATHLANLFSQLLANAVTGQSSNRRIKVGCSYSYNASPNLQVNGPVMAVVPVLLLTPNDLDTDSTAIQAFTMSLASALLDWADNNQLPRTQGSYLFNIGATFQFDITIFAALSGTNLPLLRLRNLSLALQFVSEFNGNA